ncbi:MAG TPA: hypothetical protein VFA33_13275 [Bryobacteraceae bacterium]|nr:hypothetical protein [Bryobacteraceae bacterium]
MLLQSSDHGVARCLRRAALLAPVAAALAAAQTSFSGSFVLPLGDDVIRYESSTPDDPVARLARRLERGEAHLEYREPNGYLLSVLENLHVPLSSQTLVFSKTSFQQALISPAAPRALYFNDDVYVGWVQGGDVVELASVDPSLGTIFYTLPQRRTGQPKFMRQAECLQCHASPNTLGVPGLLVRSVYPDREGFPQLQAGSFLTDHESPFRERWGGWYVTGTHGQQRHMGNVWVKDKEHPDRLDVDAGANVTSLARRLDLTPYPRPHSDIVALMVLEHQTRLHSLITRVNWETRMALAQQHAMNEALHEPADQLSESTRRRINGGVETLLRYMLFTGEPKLEAPVRGTSGFQDEFPKAGPKDHLGRSLRDLDLQRRMFRYPCSFLIYSDAMADLPKPALDYFYRRLWEVLNGREKGKDFAGLTAEDRAATLEILRDTMPRLPEYWRP